MSNQSDLFLKKETYCFDTSSIIALRKSYPKDIFETLHNKFTEILTSGKITVIDMVLEELKNKEVDLSTYIKNNLPKTRLTKFSDYIHNTQTLINTHYDNKGKSDNIKADPHVISCAKTDNTIVVTEELGGGPTQIPHICRAENVECVDIVGFFRREKIKI